MNSEKLQNIPRTETQPLVAEGIVWLELGNEAPVGMIRLSPIDSIEKATALDKDEKIVGYYTIKNIRIADGRTSYVSRRPIATFVAHGVRENGVHMLEGSSGQLLSSQDVVAELNKKLSKIWQYPSVELFISCDDQPNTGFATRWDMKISDQQQVIGFALGKNLTTFTRDAKKIIVPLDLMRRMGVKLDVTAGTGRRKAYFDSLFETKKLSLKEWFKWIFWREKAYRDIK